MLDYLGSKGVISCGIAASSWSQYTGGVHTCGEDVGLNHGIELVGWNAEEDAFIIKNSWGTRWGISGYMHIARDGNCGICLDANYVEANYNPL